MDKIHFSAMNASLAIAAAGFINSIGVPVANAMDYTYDLTNFTGYITTNCDACVLNSGDITAWSITLPDFISINSATPGAQLFVPTGDTDMVATPAAIGFNFNAPFGAIVFSTSSANVAYSDDEGDNIGFGPGQGIISACKNDVPGDCTFVGGGSGTQVIGLARANSAPELDSATMAGALTLVFGSIAVAGGRRRRSHARGDPQVTRLRSGG